MVRTRVAVSPTGYPHIGTIYQSLFDYAYARKHKGKFIVRIEDTDRERFVQDAQEKLYIALDWFKLIEDESPRKGGPFSPYVQSERLSIYKKYVEELLEKKHAYRCFCTKERLDAMRKKQQEEKRSVIMYDKLCRKLSTEDAEKKHAEGIMSVVRLKVPENEVITGRDGIRGDISFDSNLVDDQVLLKADGFPTYHLAVVVDDHLMEISDVVRGEEWISSYPKHILLYRFFAWEMPNFYHTSALRNPDRSKLSKRQGHTNVSWYEEQGYLPEAILNYIASLGWGHPEGKEIFSLEEFVNLFDIKDITPTGPIFDIEKLKWMNGVYIRKIPLEDLARLLVNKFPQFQKIPHETFTQIVTLAQSRLETLADFQNLAGHFIFGMPSLSRSGDEAEVASLAYQKLVNVSVWDSDHILSALRDVLEKKHIRMPALYLLLTGLPKGLPLPETLELLGKKETLLRLQI